MSTKASAHARGYGRAHRALRASWAPRVRTGREACARCGELIAVGAAWDLGHDDHDRTRYKGPEHASCNRATRAPERQDPAPAVGTWWA